MQILNDTPRTITEISRETGLTPEQVSQKGGGQIMESKRFFLPGCQCDEATYTWLKAKAEAEKRSLTAQLLWELEKLSQKGCDK